jgi:predicted lipoprotein with Yx(FWY)xxD motif
MSKNRIFRIAAAAAAVGAVGAGSTVAVTDAFATSTHSASSTAVKLASVKVGSSSSKLLVDASGHPVYLLTGDSMKKPLCTSSECLGAWPAVTSSAKKPALGAGIKGKLTVWTHKGMHQLVLNGHPLYLFAHDSGNTAEGQGIKDDGSVWELVTAGAAGFTGSSPSSSSPASSSSGSSSSGSTTTSPASSWS